MRALAHDLKPVVQVGNQGLSASVLKAIDQALVTHELVKVKVGGESDHELRELGVRVATATHAHLAQVIGKTLLLYRRRKHKPKLLFPGESPTEDRAVRRPPSKQAGKNLPRTNASKNAPRDPRRGKNAPRDPRRGKSKRKASRG